MSTNYYVKSEVCECCGRSDEQLHIGKSSSGWTFSFHATETVRSFDDWKIFLKGEVIVDEYGKVISLYDFVKLVESKKEEPRNHTAWCNMSNGLYGNKNFLDSEGNSFSDYDFC